MAATTITMRIDEDVKMQLQELMSGLGLDVTTFFTMAAKQAIREQALPFRPALDRYNAKTWQAGCEIEYMKSHPELPWQSYDDADKVFEEVFAEDEN